MAEFQGLTNNLGYGFELSEADITASVITITYSTHPVPVTDKYFGTFQWDGVNLTGTVDRIEFARFVGWVFDLPWPAVDVVSGLSLDVSIFISPSSSLTSVIFAGADTLTGRLDPNNDGVLAGSSILKGYDGDDTLLGTDGNDFLDGGTGADTMTGGKGDDTYDVDDIGDVVVEAPNGGTDVVRSSIDYQLPDNVEQLVLVGAALTGRGNALDNIITGNAANNVLRGEAGNDTLDGLAGDDELYGDGGNDILNGGDGNDRLFGGAGNDTLNGGAGADRMEGGLGNDTYYIDNAGDVVIEAANGGIDTIVSIFSINLVGYVHFENATLLGTAALFAVGNDSNNVLTGNNGNNVLNGRAGNDRLEGGAGNDQLFGGNGDDILNGGSGNDRLEGGAGNDTLDGGSGHDQLFGGAENDVLIGGIGEDRLDGGAGNDVLRGGSYNDTLIGGAGNDQLFGDAGDDLLNGGAGNDTLNGGAGNDRLLGGAGNDTLDGGAGVDRLEGGDGNDTLRGGAGNDTLLGGNGNDRLFGDAGNDLLNAGAGNDHLDGGAGNDTLYGGAGNDVLAGGLGNDILSGGSGQDTFLFNTALNATTNVDRITDFNVRDDTIHLENAIFTKLTATGVLNAAFFKVGPAATDADDYIIYNKATGALLYDSNGSAAGGAVQFATLNAGLNLTAADFFVV